MSSNKILFMTLIFMSIILLFLQRVYESYIDENSDEEDEHKEKSTINITKNECETWLRTKGNIYNSKYVRDPLTGLMNIHIGKDMYQKYDKECEQYTPLYVPYKELSIPSYLNILYKLIPNVTLDKVCTKKYNRKNFGKWINTGVCNTRDQILFEENISPNIKFTPSRCNLTNDCDTDDYKCTITDGIWSVYTGNYIDNKYTPIIRSNDLQIDHTVPLQNAWNSGICNETSYKIPLIYANDRTPGHLALMLSYLNTEKGEKTPHEWLPPSGELRYISNWVAVKYRYNLKLGINEFNTLHKILDKYKDFIPDTPVGPNERIGSSLIKIKNGKKDELLTNKTKINNFKTSSTVNIHKFCAESRKRNVNSSNRIESELLRKELKSNHSYLYFGILRPEMIDDMSDKQICNILFKI